MSIIEKLASGFDLELSRITMIEDFPMFPSKLLLKTIMKGCLRSKKSCHIISNETPVKYYQEDSALDNFSDKFKVHDMISDPCGWLKTPNVLLFESDLVTEISKQVVPSNDAVVFIFDSLSQLIMHRTCSEICRMIEKLLRKNPRSVVVFLVHPELHSIEESEMLEHYSTTIIEIKPFKDPFIFHSSEIMKRISGKILRFNKTFQICENLTIKDVNEFKSNANLVNSNTSNDPNPVSNLTFNLSLKPDEEEAREKLVLPFIKKETEKSEGKILYEPDDVDDYDDEDPDDDLDI
ncbi:Elongator complex protein 5 [Nymphon striatum]|nr:Elongator complex protein 5 [Nymphon striatum]